MATITTGTSALPYQRVGTIERTWRQDEPVMVEDHPSGPDAPFTTLDDAIRGAAYMSASGKVGDNRYDHGSSTFVIRKDGDAFRATRLLVPIWEKSWGTERATDAAALRTGTPVAVGPDALDVEFYVLRGTSFNNMSTTPASGRLTLDPKLGHVAIVGNTWAFVDGEVRSVSGSDPFPPPPPPPPHDVRGDVTQALTHIQASLQLIGTVPEADRGDELTKQARISAYQANMAAQGLLEDSFLADNVPGDVVSKLRRADAHLEDANWQLARKPSPDGRFNGVDIPGAKRDTLAAVDALEQLLGELPAAS